MRSPTVTVPGFSGTRRTPNQTLPSQRRCRASVRVGSFAPWRVATSMVGSTQRTQYSANRNVAAPRRSRWQRCSADGGREDWTAAVPGERTCRLLRALEGVDVDGRQHTAVAVFGEPERDVSDAYPLPAVFGERGVGVLDHDVGPEAADRKRVSAGFGHPVVEPIER